MNDPLTSDSLTTQTPPYAQRSEVVLQALASDNELGLEEPAVDLSRQRHGWNQLAEAAPRPLWKKLLAQFRDLMIWILIVAAVVAGAMGEWVDTLAIVAIVLLNGVIGFFQEERASRALAALQKLSTPMARVIRGGIMRIVPARELVPGDRLELEAGDNVPADIRLLRAFGLAIQEAALTGESVPVDKDATAVLDSQAPLGDRKNMAYLGTVVASGKASALVVATGMQTELGRIAGLLEQGEVEPTPLQRRLADLGRVLIAVCLVIVAIIFALQLMRGGRVVEALLVSVSLAVAAVPEGLPAVVTISLALGLQRMVKRNALVRTLPSVETLGSVTVICSDKTGTLTRNEMTVREIAVSHHRYTVSGGGYVPQGSFFESDLNLDRRTDLERPESSQPIVPQNSTDLQRTLLIGAWCNNAQLTPQGDSTQSWQVVGDPTEGALLVAALKAGISTAGRSQALLYELPFDSTRKAMSVVVQRSGDGRMIYTKGAPEVILSKCVAELVDGREQPLSSDRRDAWMLRNSQMAERALRVLGLAYREMTGDAMGPDQESNLIFAGLVGMIDPPREEAQEAVKKCREAGIRPVMITGDHPATALAIARELQLATGQDRAVTGVELDALTDQQLAEQVEQISVYARVSAEHKLRIVRAWKSRRQVVAMTGDGVNDAPAVKAADIGIAMGISGTDVTKEASDMVLTDDNFASIVNAIEEGRGIYDNIQKVLLFLLSCNLGEILLLFVATLLGWPTPLLPIQLLWMNLVTDGLPALALSLEPPEPGIMRRRPRTSHESILTPRLVATVLWLGVLVGGVGLAAFALSYLRHPEDVKQARAMTFCVVVYAQLFLALAARSQTYTWGQMGFFSNPMLLIAIVVSGLLQVSIAALPVTESVFEFEMHPIREWLIILVLALTPVSVVEIAKLVRSRLSRQGHTEKNR